MVELFLKNHLKIIKLVYKMKRVVNILDVTLRDGLQNEKRVYSLSEKRMLLDRLIKCGFKDIEVTSFVDGKKVPQFADNIEFCKLLQDNGVKYSALIPNKKGYNMMKESGSIITEGALFVSASDTFNKKNINTDLEGAFKRFLEIRKEDDKIELRGSISCCFKCPYEGEVSVERVVDVVKRYKDLNVSRIDIADTIGSGTVYQMRKILDEVLKEVDISKVTGHFHDTNGGALDLVGECLKYGVTTFHSSMDGIGGCPFSSVRVGNLSTQKLVMYLKERGYESGVEILK